MLLGSTSEFILLITITCAVIWHAAGYHQISPERPLDFRVRLCSHERQPFHLDTMLFFPETVKFCATLYTDKSVIALARDKQRTSFLQPHVSIAITELGAPSRARCQINYMGYGGEYRLSPDLGYYTHCQRAISHYINRLVDGDAKPEFNATNPQCPIQDLPPTYRDYISCDLVPRRWYEIAFSSSINYEVHHNKAYRQFASNHSSSFIFKPDYHLDLNGSETDWLARLVAVRAKLRRCERVRYLIQVDDDWHHHPIKVDIEYRITLDGYIKSSRNVGNGTVDHWFSGAFDFEPAPGRNHEVCARVKWMLGRPAVTLCRVFAHRGQCHKASSARKSRMGVMVGVTALFVQIKLFW